MAIPVSVRRPGVGSEFETRYTAAVAVPQAKDPKASDPQATDSGTANSEQAATSAELREKSDDAVTVEGLLPLGALD
jgi:hypothetical protein